MPIAIQNVQLVALSKPPKLACCYARTSYETEFGRQRYICKYCRRHKVTEPAADLAVCMAIASAAKGLLLKGNVVVFGEVGLAGEVRHVPFIEKRLEEAKKLGFDSGIGPKMSGRKPSPFNLFQMLSQL